MPPPLLPLGELLVARPPAIVRSAMVTLPPLMSKTRTAFWPLTVTWLAPGPLMARFELIVISLASGMVPCRPAANLIVSAPEATPARKVPGPLSARLVTVNVLGRARCSRVISRGTKDRRGGPARRPCLRPERHRRERRKKASSIGHPR